MEQRKTEAEAVALLAQKPEMLDINSVPHILLPAGTKLESLEFLMDAPRRVKGHYQFNEPESFARYVDEFKGTGTRVFADHAKRRFKAVINGCTPGVPQHADHTALLEMTCSKEWEIWTQHDGKKMSVRAFTTFLENHIKEITGEFSGGDLLAMCRSLKVSMRGSIEVTETVEDGKRALVAAASTQVRGSRDAAAEPVAFPEEIEVTLRVFNHVAPYKWTLRLRWDQGGTEGPTFWYDLYDREVVERAAFEEVSAAVELATGMKPYVGWTTK